MKCKILKSQVITQKNHVWYLCETTLSEYISSLSDTFYDFNIQRRIVKNGYLDRVYESIINGEAFLPISLTIIKEEEEGYLYLNSEDFNILDGLQRTFRLWVPFVMCNIIRKNNITDERTLTKFIDENFPELSKALDACGFVNMKYKRNLFGVQDNEQLYVEKLMAAYSNYPIFFYAWKGLNDQDIVEKMLILNAGQKPVNATHQFELLFLHFFDKPGVTPNDIKLVRAKDSDYTSVVRGKRNPKTFSMASIIIGLKSYIDGKQQRIAPTNMISVEEYDTEYSNIYSFFNDDFLKNFMLELGSFDSEMSEKNEDFVKWFSKDTTISGILGAVGHSVPQECRNDINEFKAKLNILKEKDFNLKDFEYQYKNISSRTANVGNTLRLAIFNYTSALLSGANANWSSAFSKKGGEND